MNPNHIISLMQNDYTTIGVQFVDDHNADKVYVYKVLRADMPSKGDRFVVNSQYTSSGFAIVEVVRVDDEPEINTNATYDYSWIVQKIDRARYDAVFELERQFAQKLRAIQQKAVRQQAAAQLLGEFPEGSEARKELESLLMTVSNPLAQLGESNGTSTATNEPGTNPTDDN